MGVRRRRAACTHRWQIPTPGLRRTRATCKRCGAVRQFLWHFRRPWDNSLRISPEALREMNENIRAAEKQGASC